MGTVILAPGIITDQRTADMLAEVQRRFGAKLQYAQGSYRHGLTEASGSTHDGGGAVDVRTTVLASHADKMRLVAILRIVGFAAWYRTVIPGVWGEHAHAIAIGCPDLSSGARWQVGEYRAGRDGLQGQRPDPDAALGIKPRTWEQYQHRWPLLRRRARVFDRPGGVKVGHRKRGRRVHVLEERTVDGVVWLRIPAGWIRAKRTDRRRK